jgi:hypothetical protein
MVGGIGGNNPPSGFKPVNSPDVNKVAGKPAEGINEAQAAGQAAAPATPTPDTEKALVGQLDAASALGKSQTAKGPAKSMQVLMAAIPPGSQKDKLLDNVANKVASKTVPGFQDLDDMGKALALSDIRVAILENPELSGMLGIKL